jgi:hypothetical protein
MHYLGAVNHIINIYNKKCQCRRSDCSEHANYEMMFKVNIKWIKEECEDTKGVIRTHISMKNRQHNGQKKKDKRTNNDLQNILIKLKIE